MESIQYILINICSIYGNLKLLPDPWKYIVKDTESEKKFAFRLDQSLQSARKSLLFEGLSFHATKSVKPPPDQMKGRKILFLYYTGS